MIGRPVLIACRGNDTAPAGLYGRPQGAAVVLLDAVPELSCLAAHPRLPVVYGAAGRAEGTLVSWRLRDGRAERLDAVGSGGLEPCHLVVDPSGSFLVVVNYESGSLDVFALDHAGEIAGVAWSESLVGEGPDRARQTRAHPHQAVFSEDGRTVIVPDLGSDLVRYLTFGPADGRLRPVGELAVPPGTGPRHAVIDARGGLWVSGELAQTVLHRANPLAAGGDWVLLPSTRGGEPLRSHRYPRNYPGDIVLHPGGTDVLVANRGTDTIARFGRRDASIVALDEFPAAACWPQHMLVRGRHLLVACWDGAEVSAIRLDGDAAGRSDESESFAAPGPCWLLPTGAGASGGWSV